MAEALRGTLAVLAVTIDPTVQVAAIGGLFALAIAVVSERNERLQAKAPKSPVPVPAAASPPPGALVDLAGEVARLAGELQASNTERDSLRVRVADAESLVAELRAELAATRSDLEEQVAYATRQAQALALEVQRLTRNQGETP